ncbi:MAG: AtpZ/AtpI family protein [Thiotrichales bacterium]|nr:AtpZ/AtpI family protein [Thiotrichales bacterium]
MNKSPTEQETEYEKVHQSEHQSESNHQPIHTLNPSQKRLQQQLERQAKRIQKAEQERPTLMAQTVYLGMVGLLFVLPVIAGAYLGLWLDSQQTKDYSISWTISLIFVGVFVGGTNVYLFFNKAN